MAHARGLEGAEGVSWGSSRGSSSRAETRRSSAAEAGTRPCNQASSGKLAWPARGEPGRGEVGRVAKGLPWYLGTCLRKPTGVLAIHPNRLEQS